MAARCARQLPRAESLHHEYSALAATVEVVDGVDAAIDHIHQYVTPPNTAFPDSTAGSLD